MSGFQPLVIDSGLIRRVGNDRTETRFLNLGPGSALPIVGETIAITGSFHWTFSPVNVDLRTINGGQIGDLLVYIGDKVRVRTGGNILRNLNRFTNQGVAFILTPIGWMPLII